jgi:hypothetical protein
MKIYLLIITALLLSFNSFSQKLDEELWTKRTQEISFSGSSLLFATPLNLSYNMCWHRDKIHYGIYAGATWVFYEIIDYASVGVHGGFDIYFGRKNHHPELKLGMAYTPIDVYSRTPYTDYDYDLVPVISLGYRYQSPAKRNFFRIFIGTGGIGFGIGRVLGGNNVG